MKNFIQPGMNIDLSPAAAVQSGELVVVGKIFGVAVTDGAAGKPVSIATGGVYELAKKTGSGKSYAQGDHIHFDEAQKKCDVTGDLIIGTAIEAASESATTVKVRLNSTF